jgi:hypothetical protein
MSTNPDSVVQTLSWFLAGRADIDQVEAALAEPVEFGPQSAALVQELREELTADDVSPQQLQPLVRETIEAIALGD